MTTRLTTPEERMKRISMRPSSRYSPLEREAYILKEFRAALKELVEAFSNYQGDFPDYALKGLVNSVLPEEEKIK